MHLSSLPTSSPELSAALRPAEPVHQRVPLFKALTGIRAVAAIWVVVGHFSQQLVDLFPPFAALIPLTRSGFLGVDLFFVLSGFILAHNYLTEFRSVSLPQYGRFLWVRLARLYPVHLFCLFVLLAGVGAGKVGGMHFNMPERLGGADFLRNLALVHAWGFSAGASWNGPAWSISAEWFAYLLFPLLALAVVRVQSVTVAAAFAGTMYVILFAVFGHVGTTWETLDNQLALVRVITQFAAGCLLYRVYTHGWRGAGGWEIVAWLMLAGVVGYCYVYPPDRLISLAPAPLMALFVLALANAGGPMARFLSTRTMIFWGEVSYSLYMTHDLLRMVLKKLLNIDRFVHSGIAVRLAVLLIYAACIAGMALATYFFVEKPARRWMRRRVGRGKPVDEAQLPIHFSEPGQQLA